MISEKETLSPDSRNFYRGCKDKVKFTCPYASCKLNAWAKASAKLICGHCDVPMVSELEGNNKPGSITSEGGANLPAVPMQCHAGDASLPPILKPIHQQEKEAADANACGQHCWQRLNTHGYRDEDNPIAAPKSCFKIDTRICDPGILANAVIC